MKETILKYRTRAKQNMFNLIEKGTPIDLLQILELEINLLRLRKNKYAIARYIYIRLGELFCYDANLAYANDLQRRYIRNKRINIRCVTDFDIVCDAYSYMYVELLNHFNIDAEIVDNVVHVYVVYTIDDKTYLADLTTGNIDITRIKFGMKPIYNRQILPVAPKEDKTFDEIDKCIYFNDITTEKVLAYLKQELIIRKEKFKWDKVEYVNQVYKTIANIINIKRPHIGFISGVTHIYYLLEFFIDDYKIHNIHFLNEENGLEIEIFVIKNEKERYYAFQKILGYFVFNEITYLEFQKLIEDRLSSKIIDNQNLLLKK